MCLVFVLMVSRWSAPSAIGTLGGYSCNSIPSAMLMMVLCAGLCWGGLVGVDVTDYVVVLRDYAAVRGIIGERQVTSLISSLTTTACLYIHPIPRQRKSGLTDLIQYILFLLA